MKKTLYLAAAATLLAASPVFAQETITIGFTASQTGALNNDSTAQMRGIELWRDDVNAKGGIKVGGKSYTIKLVSYDDESQNTRVQLVRVWDGLLGGVAAHVPIGLRIPAGT